MGVFFDDEGVGELGKETGALLQPPQRQGQHVTASGVEEEEEKGEENTLVKRELGAAVSQDDFLRTLSMVHSSSESSGIEASLKLQSDSELRNVEVPIRCSRCHARGLAWLVCLHLSPLTSLQPTLPQPFKALYARVLRGKSTRP